MANVQDVQAQIFEEINDPSNKIMLQVQKKQINRDEYLKKIETRCKKEGLNDEEAEDIVYLVLPYIHSAREGVQRLGSLLEQYGTYEMNGIAFRDLVFWMT